MAQYVPVCYPATKYLRNGFFFYSAIYQTNQCLFCLIDKLQEITTIHYHSSYYDLNHTALGVHPVH